MRLFESMFLATGEVRSDQGGTDANPAMLCLKHDMEEKVKALVHALPPRERLVISGFFFQGVALKELASNLNISVQRAYQIKDAAVVHLRRGIDECEGRVHQERCGTTKTEIKK